MDDDPLTTRFAASEPRLRALAFRMLGSRDEADDAVQETWLRLDSTTAEVHNLDGWLMGRTAAVDTFTHAARGADIAVIEGVMGLFDGASASGDEGSTAEIAKWLSAPVVLMETS